jgi:anti-sigma28 factor (negative regulator of flagellin synthesis)
MSNVAPIGSVSMGREVGAVETALRSSARSEPAPPRRAADKVELSDKAYYLNKLRNLPIRSDLVDSVRQQIEGGTYETEAKIDAAIDELVKDLG